MLEIRSTAGGPMYLDLAHVVAVLMPPHAAPGTACIVAMTGLQVQVDYIDAVRVVAAKTPTVISS